MESRLAKSALEIIAAPLLADEVAEPDIGYTPIEKSAELRYTLGPVYSPNALDAHDEFATADDLRKALWEFSINGDRTLRKQHGRVKAADIVELVQWPYEHEAELTVPGRSEVRKVKLPADTVYLGALWTPETWLDVKKGRVTGYSMGGAAVRVSGEAPADLVKFA